MTNLRQAAFSFALLAPLCLPATAQEITGIPGSPSATTTIEGSQLPPLPDKTFGGKIERNALQSEPYWHLASRLPRARRTCC